MSNVIRPVCSKPRQTQRTEPSASMKGLKPKEDKKQAPKVNVAKSRLYKYLQNQLVIMTFLIQTSIIIVYLTIWFNTQVLLQALLKNNIGDILQQSGRAVVQAQALNINQKALERYDEMNRYREAFVSGMTYLQNPESDSLTWVSLDEMDKSTKASTVGFWVDELIEQPDLTTYSADDLKSINTAVSYLKAFAEGLDEDPEDQTPLAAVGLFSSSSLTVKQSFTVLLPLKDYYIDGSDGFFSFANNCTKDSRCLVSCKNGDKFNVGCVSQGKGVIFSPFVISGRGDGSEDEAIYLYTSALTGDLTLLLFFSDRNDTFLTTSSLYSGSKSAVMMQTCFSTGSCILEPNLILESRLGALSIYERDRNDDTFSRFMETYFSLLSSSLLQFTKTGDWIQADKTFTTFEGLSVVSAVTLPIQVFSFLRESDTPGGKKFEITEELGQVTALVLLVFILGAATLFYFIYRTVAVVLQTLLQIRTYMLEGSPFDLATQTVKHTEMNDMLKEIKYYQMVVCFIKTIKSRDASNREELSKFLKPMEGSKNLSAQVYLFNFFMKELSEKSTEKAGISKLSEDAQAGANDLVRSIQFGHKLYSTYDKMISALISSGSYSEFELRRMNLSIFRLFEVMIGLLMKSAKLKLAYTYEDALWLYERTYRFVDQLDLNDTIRLGLLLKKAKILIHLKKFILVEDLLHELDGMLRLMLKNHRVLMYMEDEYKLLTHYQQQYLDLKSELFYRKHNFKESIQHIFEVLSYGDVYNVRARLKSLKRLTKIVKKSPSMADTCESVVKEITRIAKFTTNRNRNIIILFDITEKFIEHIDTLKTATYKMLEESLDPSDYVSMYGFDKKLHTFKEALSLPTHPDEIENEYEIYDLYGCVTDYFEFLRSKVGEQKREYYSNLEKCLDRNQKAIQMRLAGMSPVNRSRNGQMNDSDDQQDNSDSSDLETGAESPASGPIYLILAIFGKHYPLETLGSIAQSGTGLHSRSSWEPAKLLMRDSQDDLPSISPSQKKGSGLMTKKSGGETTISAINKNKSLESVDNTIGNSLVNFMLITTCMPKIQKENILQVLDRSKRSLVYVLGSHDAPPLDKTLTEFVN